MQARCRRDAGEAAGTAALTAAAADEEEAETAAVAADAGKWKKAPK
jgi:hypothetical protein